MTAKQTPNRPQKVPKQSLLGIGKLFKLVNVNINALMSLASHLSNIHCDYETKSTVELITIFMLYCRSVAAFLPTALFLKRRPFKGVYLPQ
jgi:hypothetical protein